MVLRFYILLMAFCVTLAPSLSQELTDEQRTAMMNGAMGTEFWIAIPPNEINPFNVDALEIYVVSAYDTEVTVFDAGSGNSYKRKLEANVVRTLNDRRGETNWSWEVRDYETVVRKGIRLTADKPFSVSMLNAKPTTSDGYLALPTPMWGTSYIATTYYDFREFKPWAGGFMVVAGEDGTEITITLRGVGKDQAKTSGGRSINTGTSFTVNLDAGDLYTVVGDGTTRGVFDLTGSLVTSNKPVGFISFHQRTTMPNLLVNGNGRDHLSEMNTPLWQWDTSFVTLELHRTGTNPSAKGDVFRVIASEDNTTWTMTNYDIITKQPIDVKGGVLNAGQFAEISQSTGPTILTYGVSAWSSNKPIQVVQLSCSASFDGDVLHDPFQLNLLPKTRFVKSATFQLPTDTKFHKHFVNVVFQADPSDPEVEDKLMAITIDGKPIWNHPKASSPSLLLSNITGTDIWWARIEFGTSAQAHTILSPDVPFGGYIYGYGQVDSYGWPLGPVNPNNVASDTSSPDVAVQVDNSKLNITVTELVNIPEQVRPKPLPTDQVDTGISLVGLLASDNIRLTVTKEPGKQRSDATLGQYVVEKVDTTKDGTATLYAVDYAGNVTYKPIQLLTARYPTLTGPQFANMGETVVDSAICSTNLISIENTGNDTLRITGLVLKGASTPFTVTSTVCPLPIAIAPSARYASVPKVQRPAPSSTHS
jgi:hypothetical protein